jgi:hypothetical protein
MIKYCLLPKGMNFKRKDVTQYRIGAVPIDAYRNHDIKKDKYVFFADYCIFHLLLYINWCEKMN